MYIALCDVQQWQLSDGFWNYNWLVLRKVSNWALLHLILNSLMLDFAIIAPNIARVKNLHSMRNTPLQGVTVYEVTPNAFEYGQSALLVCL